MNWKCDCLLTLYIHFCSHLWPPCLIRWASGQPGTSESTNCSKAKAKMLLKAWEQSFREWGWVPVQNCPHQCRTSSPVQWGRSPESTWESCNIHCPAETQHGKTSQKYSSSLMRASAFSHLLVNSPASLSSYHRLHVFQGDLLSQHHLVEWSNEKP